MPWTWGCDVSCAPTTCGTPDASSNGPGGRRYYQVSESVHDSATLDRELSSLRAVRDNYPKTLITLDDERPYSHEGIRQVYALDWLLNEDHKKQ